jgi:hypothetical protein
MLLGSIAYLNEEFPPMPGVVNSAPADVRVEDRPVPQIPKPTDTHQRRAVKVLLRP